MDFYFNELAFHGQFESIEEFYSSAEFLVSAYQVVNKEGLNFFIHNNLYSRPAVGVTFLDALRSDPQHLRTVMSALNKMKYVPIEGECAEKDDCFMCKLDAEEDVTSSALAECAYAKCYGLETSSVSLENSMYSTDPLAVRLNTEPEVLLANFISLAGLGAEIEKLRPAISSWDILLERLADLSNVELDMNVYSEIKKNPFRQNLAEELFIKVEALNQIVSTDDKELFEELRAKYATGEKAWYSDSSDSEKSDFKEALSFWIGEGKDRKKKCCSFHGKVKIEQFRIHLVEAPKFNSTATIVYIGPKLTKR